VQGRTITSACHDEAGFTLPEVLVALVLSIAVLAATIGFIVFGSQQGALTVTRVDALDRARQGIELMQREMRQALDVQPIKSQPTGSSYVDVKVFTQANPSAAVAATPHTVRYDCNLPGATPGTYRCDRTDQTAGTTTTVVDGLVNTPSTVFTIVPPVAPAFLQSVRMTLKVRIGGATNPIVLASSVTPRNCIDGPTPGTAACTG
jgi:prepilin-type N-terminal cleavage/methylation domain-containing protein